MSTFKLAEFVSAKDVATDIKIAQQRGLLSSAWGMLNNLAVTGNVACIGLKTTTIGGTVKMMDSIEDSLQSSADLPR